jgi:hypothetical protein
MKINSISNFSKIFAFSAVVLVTSCKKDDTNNSSSNSNTKAATMTDSSTVADNVYSDVLANAFISTADNSSVWNVSKTQQGRTGTNSTSSSANAQVNFGCAIYSFDNNTPNEYPKVLTVDFGTGCTSLDGVTRSGKIIYTFDIGALITPGATVSVMFDHYTVNGYGISGSYSIANNSTDGGAYVFVTDVTNGIITYPDQSNYHYSGNRTYTQSAGIETPLDFTDDAFSITGNSSFSASDGTSLVCQITSPLTRSFDCTYVSEGIVSFTYDGTVKGTVDFGDGTCDNHATLAIGNYSQTITLR